MTRARDVLEKKGSFVAAIAADATVLDAAIEMNTRRIGAVVVTEGDNVVGIFTERDILTRVVAARHDPAATRVADVMTTPVACCRPDTPLDECRTVITEKHIRHLPVVDGNKLIGIITAGDIMAWQVAHQQQTIDDLNQSVQYLHQYLYGSLR